jgi:glycosyltransferase involved in cell wall biosynthesis
MNTRHHQRPVLYVFTLSYPFLGKSESNFLAPELKFLASNYRIVLVPREIDGEVGPREFEYELDISFALSRISSASRSVSKLLRLVRLEVLFELVRHGHKSVVPAFLERVASDYLLMSYADDWLRNMRRKLNNAYAPPSILYGWWLTPEILRLARRAKRVGVPVIARAHGGDLYEFRDVPPGKPFRAKSMESLTRLFTVSNHGLLYLKSLYPRAENNMAVAHLGTLDKGVGPSPDLSTRVFRILSCSFINPVKRLDVARAGIERFATLNPSITIEWTHAGSGPGWSGFQENTKSSKFIFTPIDYLGIEELYQLYLSHPFHVFLNTSESEGLPVTMMEAASVGIPLVGPDVGGIKEVLHHGVNGFLINGPAGPNEVAEALQKISDLSAAGYTRFRNSSREIWLEKFKSETVYETFSLELRDILE